MGSMTARGLDVARVRGLYLSLPSGPATLDGPLSALQPESVIRAIVASLRSAPTQPGGTSFRSQRTASALLQTRAAFADLVGAAPESVVLGATQAGLQLQFAELVSRDWQLSDQVVLSRLDSDSVLTPWLRTARACGASARWAEFDLETGEVPTWQYEHLITPRTRLVSVPIGNAATGTTPDVRAIADLAHDVGALVLVDIGAAAPHVPLSLEELGADLMCVDAATFGGPTLSALIARPGLLMRLDEVSHSRAPQRFELGPLPVELLDGATAAVDHLAGLDDRAGGERRARLLRSVALAGEHTAGLWEHFDERVSRLPHVTVFGGSGPRVPVLGFTVARRRPAQVGEFLAQRGVSVWTGPSGLTQLMTAFGADEIGGAAFAGFMPHTTIGEVDQLLAGLADLG
jgi:cysteine desulfurase family protein (TIGR01976 family)